MIRTFIYSASTKMVVENGVDYEKDNVEEAGDSCLK